MTSQDLPSELWLEILSYLPRHLIRNLFGINRLLFRLATDLLYEEVRFISADKKMLHTFERITSRHLSAAGHVKRLYIRPDFLPGMRDSIEWRRPFFHSFRFLKMKNSHTNGLLPEDELLQQRTASAVIAAANEAFIACSQTLEELTIVLHDFEITKPFQSLLRFLWTSFKYGRSNLRKLSLEMTVEKLPQLLSLFPYSSKITPNLEWLDITVSFSRLCPPADHCLKAKCMLLAFISAFRFTLSTMTLSLSPFLDFSSLFRGLGYFPKLNRLEIFMSMSQYSLSDLSSLTKFFETHKDQLQHFVLKERPRRDTFYCSDRTFEFWKKRTLYKSAMPCLKTLELDLRANYMEDVLTPFSDLRNITRNITSLILRDSLLSTGQLEELVKMLSDRPERAGLQNFQFFAKEFGPRDLKLLCNNFPELKALKVVCIYYLPEYNESDVSGWNLQECSRWELCWLGISKVAMCGTPHPISKISFALAKSIPSIKTVDVAWHCACDI